MATVLTYGLIRPDAGDESKHIWMPNEKANVTHLDGHDHDGVNSKSINISSLSKTSQTLVLADWVAVAGKVGLYRQQVTMPAGLTYDNSFIRFYIDDAGDASGYDKDEVFLTTEKSGASSYWVYLNDNTVGLTVRYL